MGVGRPSTFTEEMAAEICKRIAEGESLQSICKDPSIVGEPTVYHWIDKFPAFGKAYVRAREAQAEHYAQEIVEIADTDPDPGRARNRIDARKWYASKVKPKVYGDKVLHSGDEDKPVLVKIERVIVDEPAKAIESTAKQIKQG